MNDVHVWVYVCKDVSSFLSWLISEPDYSLYFYQIFSPSFSILLGAPAVNHFLLRVSLEAQIPFLSSERGGCRRQLSTLSVWRFLQGRQIVKLHINVRTSLEDVQLKSPSY
jgi:hypothetical protein